MKFRETLTALLLLVAFYALIARCTVACFPVDKQVEAASGYEAQQMRCVEQYADRASIDRCRRRVQLAWLVGDAAPEAAAWPDAQPFVGPALVKDGGK